MRNILFVINSLDSGGAEKSLISLLNELENVKEDYKIDLLLPNKNGLFYNQIPEYVTQVSIPKPLYYMSNSFKHLLTNMYLNPFFLYLKIKWNIKSLKLKRKKNGVIEQELWKTWSKYIPHMNKAYDIAISYMNGYPNYYIIDKIIANKKCLWIHNEYEKLGYNILFDEKYYNKADIIVTISELCKDSFLKSFPNAYSKIHILENISSGKMVTALSKNEIILKQFKEFEGIRLLSIGRLVEQKNFSLAINTAKYLKIHYPEFKIKWFIIGKGPLYAKLKEQILEEKVESYIEFLGTTSNPYPYIKNSDLIVQTSIFEGKSIVLDEAKILGKFIVATDYPTVTDSIVDNFTGIISKQIPKDLAEKIVLLLSDNDLRLKIKNNLEKYKNGNIEELNKYMEVIFTHAKN